MVAGSEIQQADPELRRRTIVIVVIICVVGLALNFYFDRYLNAAGEDLDLMVKRLRVAIYLLAVSLLPAIYFAFRLFLLGRRALYEQRFPPVGVSVIKNTRVLRGRAAKLRGLLLEIFSIVLLVTLISLPIILLVILNIFAVPH